MTSPLFLLPLDDRPVNLDFPALLAEVAGEQLLTPPAHLLGRFLQPGNTEELSTWLARAASQARGAIISLDMLAYGGLVASRTPQVTVGDALERLQVLREIKAHYPHFRIFAFNVIMRLTITGADAKTRASGRDIFRYSVLRDQAERLGDAAAAAELVEIERRIPTRLLEAYLGARARNHAVNRAAIELLADGVLDFLALVQEDTAPAGLHIVEQQDLLALAQERADATRWRLYPGTDEAAVTLLARYLLQETDIPFSATIRLRDSDAAQHPALFEDIPLAVAAPRHLDAVGGVSATQGVALAVHTFTPPQPDLFEMSPLPTPTWETALQVFPDMAVAPWLASFGSGPLAVADVAYCNGGDPHLLDALLASGRYWELEGYAGWNTAGNTLGTAFAHAAVHAVAAARGMTPAMERAHATALLVRLLDDGLYQSVVRAAIMRRAEENGWSPLNLLNGASTAQEWVSAAMHSLWDELCARHSSVAAHDRPFVVELPWGRLFEVRVRVVS